MPPATLFTGKTLEDAVKKGLEALGLARAEAMITVIEEGSGGFLGIGARPYRVRIMPRPGGAIREPEEREGRDGSGRRERGGRAGREPRGGRARGGDRAAAAPAGRGERRGRGGERPAEARGPRRPRSEERKPAERRASPAPARMDEPPEPRVDAPREPRGREPIAPPPLAAERAMRPAGDAERDGGEAGAEGRRRRRRGRRGGRGRGGQGRGPERFTTEAPEETRAPMTAEAVSDHGPLDVEPREFPVADASEARQLVESSAREFHEPREMRDPEPREMRDPGPREMRSPEPREFHEPHEMRDSEPREPREMRDREPRERAPRPMREDRPATPALSNDALAAEGKRWTEEFLGAMGFEATVNATADGDRVDVVAEVGANDELLTGPKGEVRQALQHLLNRMVNRGEGSRYHLQLEINDFWKRREEELEQLARRLADEAVNEQRETVTEYLNAQERRIIHVALREDSRVRTYALGDGMIKRLAVAPADHPEGGRGE